MCVCTRIAEREEGCKQREGNGEREGRYICTQPLSLSMRAALAGACSKTQVFHLGVYGEVACTRVVDAGENSLVWDRGNYVWVGPYSLMSLSLSLPLPLSLTFLPLSLALSRSVSLSLRRTHTDTLQTQYIIICTLPHTIHNTQYTQNA